MCIAGCEVYGDKDSPVIPLMLYNPTKIAAFSRECLARGVRAHTITPARAPRYTHPASIPAPARSWLWWSSASPPPAF